MVTAKYKCRTILSATVLFMCTVSKISSKNEHTTLWFEQGDLVSDFITRENNIITFEEVILELSNFQLVQLKRI